MLMVSLVTSWAGEGVPVMFHWSRIMVTLVLLAFSSVSFRAKY